ncbi:MAG TPA: amidase family protein [Vicinamibacterales bacterium]|jgi:amidase|nr:amidase family protein [Vicinamibacterales bacterium]
MSRLMACGLMLGSLAVVAARPANQGTPAAAFSVVEASIGDMRTALARGRVTSRGLVQQSLDRIARYEGRLNAAITINLRALDEADARDRERRAGKSRGPLHGIPIALKDNIHTTDMPTTGGALAFATLVPPYEATITTRLRAAGAVIIAKTVMTELANWVASDMPTNYSSLAGFGFNPYDPRPDPRPASDGRPVLPTGGSSSGIGTAASFWAANVGTETSGSILNPASRTMLVGIKPTVGRISRYGVIPITADQDTPGPMARSVADAAALLGVLEGGMPDPRDPATRTCTPPPRRDYTPFLRADALNGARIGVPRAFFYEPLPVPGARGAKGGLSAGERQAMNEAIGALKAAGATIVDPADLPSVLAAGADSFNSWPVCSGLGDAKGRDDDCSVVLKYGMKRDFNAWLASLGAAAPVKSLTELRTWNRAHQGEGTLKYGQAQLDISDEMDVVADRGRYERDRARDVRLTGANGIDAAIKEHRLDALLFPGPIGAAIAAKPGYPTVIVPFATVPNLLAPPGFDARPTPFGVSFTGGACSEPRLIALAYAFEQATKRRRPPPLE